jgi:hypothetical protein
MVRSLKSTAEVVPQSVDRLLLPRSVSRSVSADPSFLFMLQYIIFYVALIFLEPLH